MKIIVFANVKDLRARSLSHSQLHPAALCLILGIPENFSFDVAEIY